MRAAEGGGASDRAEFLERVAAGTFAAAAAAVGVRPEEAGAFCGEPYPYWAYFMDFDEVFVPFKFEGYTGSLFARTVGFVKEQQKVLCGRMRGSMIRLLFRLVYCGMIAVLPCA